MTLAEHYVEATRHVLHGGVPENIRVHFDTARNIYVYAWFSFRFFNVADLHALGSLEYALRVRLEVTQSLGLSGLLKRAIAEGLIVDCRMRHWQEVQRARADEAREQEQWPEEFRRLFGSARAHVPEADTQASVRRLVRLLPRLRNELAHGSAFLYSQGSLILETCCDLINQLFALPEDASAAGSST
jgi:hypothetical protein